MKKKCSLGMLAFVLALVFVLAADGKPALAAERQSSVPADPMFSDEGSGALSGGAEYDLLAAGTADDEDAADDWDDEDDEDAADDTDASDPADATDASQDAAYSVTIVFKKAGGSGTMDNLTVESDTPATLPANAFEKEGCEFTGWNTEKDGSGTAYEDQADVSALADAENDGKKITLYAQWRAYTVTITFDANGGEGTMDALSVQGDKTTRLTANAFEREGYAFKGWNTEKDGSGTAYKDREDVSDLAAKENDGQEITLYAQWKTHKVTVTFKKNGGKGTMNKLTVESDKTTKLPANKFKKTGFAFAGWNTKSDGTGTAYKNKANVTSLATAANDGKKITLYAQWKLKAPKLKKAQSPSPDAIYITYTKNTKAEGYEIQYSTKKNFKNASTMQAKKKSTSARLMNVTPNKNYYIRIRSWYIANSAYYVYSDWSNTLTAKVKNGTTINNTKCMAAIEADVKLTGSGTGYHAKLVLGNDTSAVSFGIQYDSCAAAPYTEKTMALIENISSNGAGGQSYVRPSDLELQQNKTYHLMLAVNQDGTGAVYVDYKKIGTFSQPGIANRVFLIRVEACARLNGDSVNAVFSNVKYKVGDDVKAMGDNLGMEEKKQNAGLSYKQTDEYTVQLSGTVCGVNGDWDSDYEGVSEILQFN